MPTNRPNVAPRRIKADKFDRLARPLFPDATAFRRRANSRDGSIPLHRAIADTFAPGVSASPTIRGFSSSDHDR
jgi:hypothetical protein